MSGWQPIETAPKGDFPLHVLLAYPNGVVSVGGWDQADGVWRDSLFMQNGSQPTRWMFLPDPP